MNSGADRIVRHYHADDRGSDGTAFDEFAADLWLAGLRFCRWCCHTWNRDSPRLSAKPGGRHLCRHRHGTKCPADTPDRNAVGALAGLEAVQPGACEEGRLA